MREEKMTDPPPQFDVDVQEDVIVLTVETDGPKKASTLTVPRNSITVLLAQLVVFALVVAQLNRSLKRICFWVIRAIDVGFEKLYSASVWTKQAITSESTSYLLANIKKILLIILMALFILDLLGVVDTGVPTWLLSL